jgi:hypothetical protein
MMQSIATRLIIEKFGFPSFRISELPNVRDKTPEEHRLGRPYREKAHIFHAAQTATGQDILLAKSKQP